jgi:hypothetical protein
MEIYSPPMIKTRSYFSIPYLCGAARFSREALFIERSQTVSDIDRITHRAYVVAAVTSAAAALEAMINEIFCDANEPLGSCVADLSNEARERLANLWEIQKTSTYPILDKFDVAHVLITGKHIDKTHHYWGNATQLVRLRNDFVHFEPSWSSQDSNVKQPKFAKSLHNLFADNALAGSGNAFYPEKLLGHGCAAWAVKSALEFADNFWSEIDVTPHYQSYRHMFVTGN